MKTLKSMTDNYMVTQTRHTNSYVIDAVRRGYEQGARDLFDELTRYFNNVMPKYYRDKLEERRQKMEI